MSIAITAKRMAIVLFATLLIACDSGGFSGVAGPSQTVITEVETEFAALLVNQPELSWIPCAEQRALECASVLVPLDYSNPEGETISIAMARRQADVAAQSRTLFMNPGGPGVGGIDTLDAIMRFGEVSETMTDAFNFVSFDPRGLGSSQAVSCDSSEYFAQDPYPINRAEVEFNFNKIVNFAQKCAQSDGDYIKHLGSYNVVRDINEMRKVLGLTQIDFLGFSYGTRLAALYMQTYPQSTGRFVLDGSMKPEPSIAPLVLGGLLPAQANINALAAACIGVDVVCSSDEFLTDLRSRVDELGAQPASQESSLVFLLLQFAAERPGFKQTLIDGLAKYLDTQDVGELVSLDTELGLSEAAEFDGLINLTAFTAVMCADDATRPTIDSIDALRSSFNAESDLLAETRLINAGLINAGLCAGWPETINPIPQIATNQAPISLVIGGPSDAQTPLIFAQEMAVAVGGQFLRSEHDGHTTVFTPKNSCTNTVVETFLLTGNLPVETVCAANANVNASALNWRDEMWRY